MRDGGIDGKTMGTEGAVKAPSIPISTSVQIHLVELPSGQTLVSSDPLLFVRLPLLDHLFEAFLIEVGHGDPEM